MDPIERALDVRQSIRESAYDICIGGNAKSNAVDNSGEAFIGTRHEVNISVHSWPNVSKLPFTEVG